MQPKTTLRAAGLCAVAGLILWAAGCAAGSRDTAPAQESTAFAWLTNEEIRRLEPLELIEYLRAAHDHWAAQADGRFLAPGAMLEPMPSFVRAEHVPALIELLDDDRPTAGVVSPLSSILHGPPSKVGIEAALLITGFHSGQYPPRGHLWSGQYHPWQEQPRWSAALRASWDRHPQNPLAGE